MNQNAVPVEKAGEIAIAVLGFLAEDMDRLGRFLSLTGLSPEEIRAQAATQAFQAALLDYILKDETLLLTFSANANIDPALVEPAYMSLTANQKHQEITTP